MCAATLDPPVIEPGCADSGSRHKRNGDEGVRDAAMMLEFFDGTSKTPEDVKVRSLGSQYGSQCGIGSFSIETGATDAGAGKEMGDGLHGVLHFMVAEKAGLRG